MTHSTQFKRYIYWLDESEFKKLHPQLKMVGYSVGSVKMTPCETLNATGNKVLYATPQLWSRMCTRQGSWYRESDKAGKTLVVSARRLPKLMQAYLDAELTDTQFMPDKLPGTKELQALVGSPEYQNKRPDEWDNPGIKDSIMFKIFFTATRFWGIGDNLSRFWLNHRANHANFLNKKTLPYMKVRKFHIR